MVSSQGDFLSTALASIAGAADADDGSEFDSLELDVSDVRTLRLLLTLTGGDAACNEAIRFSFVGSVGEDPPAGTDRVYETEVGDKYVEAEMNGTTAVVWPAKLDVSGYSRIKLFKIENLAGVAGHSVATLNVTWGKTYDHRGRGT